MIQRYNGSDRRLTYLFDNANHVEVDPIQTAGTPVADITIDGETTRLYAPQGGGGTDVEANPSGTPTADLDTIRIGQVIYDIPGSGGGSRKFEETLIFDTPTSSTGNITVSSMSNADELIFIIGIFADNDYQVFSNAISMTELKKGERVFIGGTVTTANGSTYSKYASVKYINDTTIAIVDAGGHSWAETGYLYRIYKRRYASNSIYLPSLYSEEEREVGVWTDGKPLYQKTVKWSSVPNGRVDGLAHNIQDVDYIQITEWVYGDVIVGHETSDQQYWAQIFSVNSTGIYYRFGPGWGSNLPLVVTFQYTKTTDQPGSGTWTPEGEFAHHYSTSEKIIGTWVDGSTLYERTFSSTSALTNNSWNLNICGTSGSEISIKKFDGLLYGSDYSNQMFPLSYFRSSSEFSTICTNSTRDDINLLPKIDGIGTLYIDHITLQYTKTT